MSRRLPKRKPVVGETLVGTNVGNALRGVPSRKFPMIVESVGRQYFYCRMDNGRTHKFDIETWREQSGYDPTVALFETEQEYQDSQDRFEILRYLAVRDHDIRGRCSVGTLREIHKLLTSELDS